MSVSNKRSSYCSGVTPWRPKVSTPRWATAAATSSWVERGLHPVRYTLAPPSWSTRARLAVLASRWTETAARRPEKGFSRAKRASIWDRAGMNERTQSIFRWPEGARDISFTMLIGDLLK